MRVYTDDKKLLIKTEAKTIHFDLPTEVINSLKHELDPIIKHIIKS